MDYPQCTLYSCGHFLGPEDNPNLIPRYARSMVDKDFTKLQRIKERAVSAENEHLAEPKVQSN